MMRFEDEELVQHCRSGDADAFGVLVHKYQDMVYAYAYQKVRNDADAKDIVQEVFLRAFRHLDQLRRPHQFRTWLYTIMSNECKRWLARKAKSRQRETGLEDAAETDLQVEPEYVEQSADWQVNLEQAIAELPEDNRVVVSMFYMSDCSLKEIGKFLGVSANTVKGKLHRARRQLGKILSQHYGRRLEEHKLEGGFLMQVMEQLHQVPRPIIPPAWREQFVRNIPLAIAGALCVLVGMLGLFSNSSHEQPWPMSAYSYPVFETSAYTIEAVELVWLPHTDDPVLSLAASGGADGLKNAGTQGSQLAQASSVAQNPDEREKEKITISGRAFHENSPGPGLYTAVPDAHVYIYDRGAYYAGYAGTREDDGSLRFEFPQGAGIRQQTVTQADGSFQFQIPRPEDKMTWTRLSIVAQHPDYSFGWAKKLPWIELAEGADNAENMDIMLTRPAAITGVIADEAGNPIQGADVQISSVAYPFSEPGARPDRYLFGGAIPLAAVKTNVKGEFTFHSLPENSGANVDISAQGYVADRKYNVRAGSTTLIFKLKREGRIEGRVTPGETGKPVKGIVISAVGIHPTRGRSQSRTDENGHYALGNLAAGEYVVMLAEEHPNWTAVARESVKVSEGGTVRNVDLELIKGGFITGRVTDKDTDEPIPGHNVNFYDAARPESQYSAHAVKTDESGFYRFCAAPGEVRVYIFTPAGYEYASQVEEHVTVIKGETVSNVDFQFQKASN